MKEQDIKTEMRLFALESLVCQHAAATFSQMPRDVFDAQKKQALDKTATAPLFAAVGDPATSDLLSAEFHESLQRLYEMIQSHLDKNKTHLTR